MENSLRWLAGTMAAGIQSADELVLTEMIFNGAFSPLSAQQAVALLSCFLWHEKSDVGIKVTPEHARV
jgi:ATP-dependent RNA helicase DOB1